MKNKIYRSSLLLSTLILTSCREVTHTTIVNSSTKRNVPFKMYDLFVETNYTLLFDYKGHCEFSTSLFSSIYIDEDKYFYKKDDAETKFKIKSFEGENIDQITGEVEWVLSSGGKWSGNYSENDDNYDFYSNYVTIQLTKKENVELTEKVTINKVIFEYEGVEYPKEVNVTIYPNKVSATYPEPFWRGVSFSPYDTSDKHLIFSGHPSYAMDITSYGLLSHDEYVKLEKMEWYGGADQLLEETREGELTINDTCISFEEFGIYNCQAYFTFSHPSKLSTPYYSNVLYMTATTYEDGQANDYYMSVFVKFEDQGDYFDEFYDDLYKRFIEKYSKQ